MGANSCLNENPVRILIRQATSSEITTRKILGNIVKNELIYVTDTNRLYICTQSTNGSADGVIVEIGI